MDRNEQEPNTDKPRIERTGRTWTERYLGPIRYRRYSDLALDQRPSILFKFALEPGQSELPEAVYAILREMKYLPRSPKHGGGLEPTGLKFIRDTRHGRCWRLPDTQTGRCAADILDAKLSELAARLAKDEGQAR